MHPALLLASLITTAPADADPVCPASFDAAIEQTLSALNTRDLARYMGTLAADSEIVMILPDGSRWNGRDEVEAGHREWFDDATWHFNATAIQETRTAHFGIAVYQVSVDRPERPGSPFLLSMGFAPGPTGCWHLFHDQNTALPVIED